MYKPYIIFTIFILFVNTPFGQNDSLGIIEENKTDTKNPAEVKEPSEVSGPGEIQSSTVTGTEDETVRIADTLASAKNQKSDKMSYTKENFNDIDLLKEEAKRLHVLSEKLYKKSESLEDESDDLDKAIEDLEDKADDLEDQAEELLKQAGYIQTCIALTKEAQKNLRMDSIQLKGDTVVSEDKINDQKILMLKMRNSADELLIKTKNIALKIRKMREDADLKNDLSDKLDDKAEELKAKAKELEEAAEYLQERQNKLPYSVRYPFKIGHQIRITAVPPFNDEEPHILFLSGLNASYFFNKALNIGIEDITLRFQETIYGKRVGISASAVASYSYFIADRFELGAGGGLAVQGQVGADRSSEAAITPFVKFYNENWVSKRFSIGPVIKINYLVSGNLFAKAYPFDSPRVLPQGAWWLDFGITYSFHF